MFIRRALFGLLALLAIILAADSGPPFVNAEDKAETSSGERAQADASGKQQAGEETIEIPLDQIWGSIGSKSKGSLRSIEPEYFINRNTPENIAKYGTPEGSKELHRLAEKSLTYHIELAMNKKRGKTGPGFVVVGTGKEALQGVCDVIVNGDEPSSEFPQGTGLSLIFFTHPAQPSVYLDRVERSGKIITIRYFLLMQGQLHATWRLAMIPLGTLPRGHYHVRMIRSPMKKVRTRGMKRIVSMGFAPVVPEAEPFIICQPFSFSITANE